MIISVTSVGISCLGNQFAEKLKLLVLVAHAFMFVSTSTSVSILSIDSFCPVHHGSMQQDTVELNVFFYVSFGSAE